MIGTPCGNGMLTTQYLISLLETFQRVMGIKHNIFVRDNLRKAREAGALGEDGIKHLSQLEAANLVDIDIGLYTLQNESLLTRGRNHIAAVAIRQGWDKLFFIDSDAKWTFDQFMSVAMSPHDFTAGTCPLKVLPINLNYLPFEDDTFYHKDAIRSVGSLKAMREGHGSQFIPVAFIGTAFMCLSRKVMLAMAEKCEEYQYPNPQTGHLHTHWNIFSTKPMNGKYMSEDWSACHLARELGFEVMMNADVIISHVGNMTFTPEMASIEQAAAQ